MIIEPKIIGGVCLTAHPLGLQKSLEKQINYIKTQEPINSMPKRILVLGGSNGYGLATRIAAAFGGGAGTLNVSLEREPSEKKPASPGWYNNKYFDETAKKAGFIAESMNADAFSHETRRAVIERIKELFTQVDLVIYSLASPVRKDPDTGETYKSVLKPLSQPYKSKSVNFINGTVGEVAIEPAEGDEKRQTVKVMGGEDWLLWTKALLEAGVLAKGAKTIAYSYIGPEVTHAVYRAGTIGAAKEHLEKTAEEASKILKNIEGDAVVSVNKALVTRASSVIPVVPLYISLLFKVMKEKKIHEGCIEQMHRMLSSKIYGAEGIMKDADGMVHMDDWEMRDDVQSEINKLWDTVSTESLGTITDIVGFRKDFMHIHGFEWEGVDYTADTDTFG